MPLRPFVGRNITVRAAAGTGKTWLLTSRLIALLLQGVAPGSVLAITFTRKAAAEIYRRVTARLLEMATAEDAQLREALHELGIVVTARTLGRARAMYETLLAADQPLRTTTFHAFCQEILRRFPLESEVPPGFELTESITAWQQAAWRAFERETTVDPAGSLAQALEALLHACGGIANTRQALQAFLDHRSDWWAYTEGHDHPLAYAETQVHKALELRPETGAFSEIRDDTTLLAELARYATLLRRHATPTNIARATDIDRASDPQTPCDREFDLVKNVFFTAKMELRRLRRSTALETRLGDAVDEFLALHERIGARLQQINDYQLRLRTASATYAWYHCGYRLLDHYQRIKTEQGLLDFDDLEWKAYRLLNRSQHAEWVQYKLDQRIDHLLVDEFQDTNPTQWRLLLPLLKEMAAGGTARNRSVLIVGDEKQSIYRFRRADPGLFNVAQSWLKTHMGAAMQTQDKSWRSSSAIIQFLNLIFSEPDNALANMETPPDDSASEFLLQNFRTHDTHHRARWGRVELLPLVRHSVSASAERGNATLRDPLRQPRTVEEDRRYRAEGQLVVTAIEQLVGQPIDDGGVRPLEYGDIMVLMRDRTHAPAYEAALRHAGIPYIGVGRGMFMQCLEVQDLVQLIRCLIAPYDDLALASVLRSPLFSCSDADLLLLAQADSAIPWRKRLAQLATGSAREPPLGRAHRLLERWSAMADKVPVHDLLDKIYMEGNVIARYVAAAPPHLHNRIQGNLRRFVEFALEADSGRYPSLAHFLDRLPILAEEDRQMLSDTADTQPSYVRMMTIHAAKGLERPVVFLVDAMRDYRNRASGVRALVDWPVEASRPRRFQLIRNKACRDSVSAALVATQNDAMRREEAQLLYVALTRAKHALFISACESVRGHGRGWYEFIEDRLRKAVRRQQQPIPGLTFRDEAGSFGAGVVLEHGIPPSWHEPQAQENKNPDYSIDSALAQPLPIDHELRFIYPSRTAAEEDGGDELEWPGSTADSSRTRGILIHRMLELLTTEQDQMKVERRLEKELMGRVLPPLLKSCWDEARAVIDEPALRDLFDPAYYLEARNEVSILYRRGATDVYGVIDRLLVRDNQIVIIDYKTHVAATYDNVENLARPFTRQMGLYVAGVKKLWSSRSVRSLLLFTAVRLAIDVTQAAPQTDYGEHITVSD
ncbi:MAG: UvrD-helicase domain-containing protein [Gammaproteobacteria bacterium]|nr:UvrD-helicase domain-containing protein [Gammaproteobacteria bacterium]